MIIKGRDIVRAEGQGGIVLAVQETPSDSDVFSVQLGPCAEGNFGREVGPGAEGNFGRDQIREFYDHIGQTFFGIKPKVVRAKKSATAEKPKRGRRSAAEKVNGSTRTPPAESIPSVADAKGSDANATV